MKKCCFLIVLLVITSFVWAQKQLPSVQVEDLQGKTLNIREILNDSVPVVLSFWSTTCKPCITELDAFGEDYEERQEELGFKVVAVSTDDERSASKVKVMVNGRNWPFEVLLDKNQDLKRAMNVVMEPQLFILDKDGKIVYAHTGYVPQGEEEVYNQLRKLKK